MWTMSLLFLINLYHSLEVTIYLLSLSSSYQSRRIIIPWSESEDMFVECIIPSRYTTQAVVETILKGDGGG